MNALAFCRFFARFRHVFAAAIAALTLFFAAQLSGLEVGTRFAELLPSDHPFIDTYRYFSESFGSANTISVAVVAREGDLYQEEVLRGLEWVTEQVGSSVVITRQMPACAASCRTVRSIPAPRSRTTR